MEGDVGVEESNEIAVDKMIATLGRDFFEQPVHGPEMLAERFQMAWEEAFRGFHRGKCFDRFADFVEFHRRVAGERADDGAEPWNEFDEALGRELGHRLADRSCRNAEFHRELLVVEPGSRWQRTIQQAGAEGEMNTFRKRLLHCREIGECREL